jgi:hypothetical protein
MFEKPKVITGIVTGRQYLLYKDHEIALDEQVKKDLQKVVGFIEDQNQKIEALCKYLGVSIEKPSSAYLVTKVNK